MIHPTHPWESGPTGGEPTESLGTFQHGPASGPLDAVKFSFSGFSHSNLMRISENRPGNAGAEQTSWWFLYNCSTVFLPDSYSYWHELDDLLFSSNTNILSFKKSPRSFLRRPHLQYYFYFWRLQEKNGNPSRAEGQQGDKLQRMPQGKRRENWEKVCFKKLFANHQSRKLPKMGPLHLFHFLLQLRERLLCNFRCSC